MTKQVIQQEVDRFVQLVHSGLESWIEAGKIVASAVDKDPDWVANVNKAHPEISEDTIWAFDRIGRNQLHPKLLMSNCPGAKRLRRLPYASQQKYADEPVELLVRNGGNWDTLNVSIYNLTPDQSKQVFGTDGVRTVPAQRAYIESENAATPPIQFDEPFRVSGRTLVVVEPCKLTAKQLANILAQME